jgi:uncharacterized SAM-binding protein YcdF (DUF218 family)
MFFYLSKIAWIFFQPSNLLIVLFAGASYLYWSGSKRTGLRAMFAGAVIYAVGGLSPLGNMLIVPLEQVYVRDPKQAMDAPQGFIVLGGAVDTIVAATRGDVPLSEAAERLTGAAALARRFPQAKIVFSGGNGALAYSGMTEAEGARQFCVEMGIDLARVIFEDRSRTTYENALFTKEILGPHPGESWLLVTSAFHMPRAAGAFRAVGFEVTPWPVDYRTRGYQDLIRFPSRASDGWHRIDLAVKEWTGLVAYRLTGRWLANR